MRFVKSLDAEAGRSVDHNARASVRAIVWQLATLLLFSLLATVVAYQVSPEYSIDVGSASDAPFVQGFNDPESNQEGSYRWTSGDSALLLPSVGYKFNLSLKLDGSRPDNAPSVVRLKVDGRPLAELQPKAGLNEYQFVARSLNLDREPVVIEIDSSTFQPDSDKRTLGVILAEVSVRSLPVRGLLVIPPLLHVLYLLAGVAFLFLTGERLGLGRRIPLAAGLVSLGASVLLVFSPLAVATRYETVFLAGLLAYVLTLLARAGWFRVIAILWVALLFLGVALNAAPDLYLCLAPFIVLLILIRPRTERSDLALVVALSTFVIIPLFLPGVTYNGDQPVHLFWLSELDKLFENGVFYTRWAPDQAFGWGGPIFNFYAPLSWYVMEGFHLAGMTFVSAMKATLALDVLAGMVGMYLFVRDLAGRAGGVVAAVGFGYFPYFVSEIHSRGEVAETLAIGLIPPVLWAFHQLVARRRIAFLPAAAALFGLLMLSHNITAMFFAPFLGAYLVFTLLKESICRGAINRAPTRRRLGRFFSGLGYAASALGLGLMVSAFFWLPAVLEKKYIAGGVSPFAKENPFPFHSWYIPYDWLYSLHLGNLYDEEGRFYAFGIHFILAAVAIAALIVCYRRQLWRTVFPFFAVMLLLLVSLQLDVSEPFWKSVPLVGFIQYPWRIMGLTAVCTSVLIGGVAGLLADRLGAWTAGLKGSIRPQHILVVVISVVFILTSLVPFEPQFEGGGADYNSRSANLARAADWKMRSQFLPVWVTSQSLQPRKRPSPINLTGSKQLGSISIGQQRVNYAEWRVSASRDTSVTFDVNYFPGWQAYVDGAPVKTYAARQTGQIVADLPEGDHRLELRFESTPLRSGSEFLSGLSLVVLLAFSVRLLYQYWKLERKEEHLGLGLSMR